MVDIGDENVAQNRGVGPYDQFSFGTGNMEMLSDRHVFADSYSSCRMGFHAAARENADFAGYSDAVSVQNKKRRSHIR